MYSTPPRKNFNVPYAPPRSRKQRKPSIDMDAKTQRVSLSTANRILGEDLPATEIEPESLRFGTTLFPVVMKTFYEVKNDTTVTLAGNVRVAQLKLFNWRNMFAPTTYSTWRFATSYVPRESALWEDVYTNCLVKTMTVKFRYRWAGDIDITGAVIGSWYPRGTRLYCEANGTAFTGQQLMQEKHPYTRLPGIQDTNQMTATSGHSATSTMGSDGWSNWSSRTFTLEEFAPEAPTADQIIDFEQDVLDTADPWLNATIFQAAFYLIDEDTQTFLPAPGAAAYYYPKIECAVSYPIMYYGRKNKYSFATLT